MKETKTESVKKGEINQLSMEILASRVFYFTYIDFHFDFYLFIVDGAVFREVLVLATSPSQQDHNRLLCPLPVSL